MKLVRYISEEIILHTQRCLLTFKTYCMKVRTWAKDCVAVWIQVKYHVEVHTSVKGKSNAQKPISLNDKEGQT